MDRWKERKRGKKGEREGRIQGLKGRRKRREGKERGKRRRYVGGRIDGVWMRRWAMDRWKEWIDGNNDGWDEKMEERKEGRKMIDDG